MSQLENHPNSLPREERLRGRSAVSSLFAQGESGFVYPVKYLYCEGADAAAPTSVMFSVPKRFHKRANRRNLLRRRLKEAYRLQKSLLKGSSTGLNIALIYTTKEQLDYNRIATSVAKILTQISEKRNVAPRTEAPRT